MIDTGVAYRDRNKFKRVPDLAKTDFVDGYDFVNRHEYGLDDHGHGTHVAGTIAQSTHNGIGVAGVAYRARIMPLKVLSARGFGSVADIAESIRFAADNGAKVINMSLGGSRSSKILGNAVKYAVGKGVTVVCAAGNDGRGKVSYPAAYPGAIAVAATQFDRTTTFYSNWGKEIDVAAPGGNTRVDQNNDGLPDGVMQNTIQIGNPSQNDYLLFMGTSMASPHVAGVAALVVERGVTDPAAVEKVLEATASHPKKVKWDERHGAGIVDAAAAVSKTTTAWGGYRFGLAGLLSLLLMVRLRDRRRLGLRFGPGAAVGLLFGSAGLFFLPALGLEASGAVGTLMTNGLPSWDLAVLGAAGHGNPLFFSLLVPAGLAGLLYGVRRAAGCSSDSPSVSPPIWSSTSSSTAPTSPTCPVGCSTPRGWCSTPPAASRSPTCSPASSKIDCARAAQPALARRSALGIGASGDVVRDLLRRELTIVDRYQVDLTGEESVGVHELVSDGEPHRYVPAAKAAR